MPLKNTDTPVKLVTPGQINQLSRFVMDMSYRAMHQAVTELSQGGHIDHDELQKVIHEFRRIQPMLVANLKDIVFQIANRAKSD